MIILEIAKTDMRNTTYALELFIDTTGAQPDLFQGRGGFVKLGRFDEHFVKKSRKKAPQGKFLEFFLLDTLKLHFEWQI